MPEQDIMIILKAMDEASRVIRDASDKIKGNLAEVETAGKKVVAQQEEVQKSTRGLIAGFSGAATAAFSLYNAYDRVADMQVQVDRANLQVKTSANSLQDAQERLSAATAKYGADSSQARAAADDLSLAQERYQVAVERAEMVQGNMNEAMVQSALQVIPTAITMVDSLSKAWKNFPDVTKTLSNISSKIGDVGSTAKTAALGVGAFVGGFLVMDSILGAIPEDMRAVAGALVATIAAIVAATVAWMAFHGTMTVGVAVPVILAAVGMGIAGIKAAVGMAAGGIIREPTLVLAGEAGPEVYMPLSRYESMISEMSETQHFEINPVIHIGNITGVLSPSQVIAAVTEGTAKGVSQAIAEAVRRRRG